MSTITQQVPQPAFPELASPEAAHPVSELIDATEVLLNSRKIEVYTGPSPDGYASRVDYVPGEHVPLIVDGTTIAMVAVADIFP